jgi:glycosyltransferase involved in cell wall biosynthesis
MDFLVSVILPCYNGSRWLGKAIESVLRQTYKNLELVIVDDGSTDNSKAIIDSYVGDSRIRYFYQSNRGFSGAINRGIMESQGYFVGFIGQDDIWLPRKLELQVKYLAEHPEIDLVHSYIYFIDCEGKIIGEKKAKMPDYCCSRLEVIKRLFLNNFICFETVLVKKQCFSVLGFFDERMLGFSDHDMWLRLAGSYNIGYLGSSLVEKRRHDLQISKAKLEKVLRDEFLLVKKNVDLYPFLEKVENKKLSTLYYPLGLLFLKKGNVDKAKINMLKTIRCQPLNLGAVAAYMSPVLFTVMLTQYQKLTGQNSLSYI